jgi:hypothetical protein
VARVGGKHEKGEEDVIIHNTPPPIYPTHLSTITVRFPAKQPPAQGLGQLLGGGKDFWKEKGEKGLMPIIPTTMHATTMLKLIITTI